MTKSPKTTTAPTGQIAPFGLRMLPELREKIEQAARESGRSMNAEIVSRLEESFGLKPPSSGLHPLEAVFKAYQLRQSISSLQAEITSLSTQRASLQNILGNTKLVAQLVKTDEAIHTSSTEMENLNGLIRSLSDDIAIRTAAMVSMEAELYDLEKETPKLFDKQKTPSDH